MAENLSAEVLLQILDRMPGIAFASSMDPATGKMEWLYVSPKMAELHGLPGSVLQGDPAELIARFVDEDRARLEVQMAASLQTLAPLVWTGRITHESGEIRWVETQTTYARSADGMILSYGIAVDVTERKRTEAALEASESARRASEKMHRAVVDALPVGVLVMEPSGKFPVYNAAAEKYAGRAPDKHGGDLSGAFGTFETDGVTPFPNENLPLLRALGGEEAPEAEMVVRNGQQVGDCWVPVNGLPIRDEGGNIVAGMVAFQDVTSQRQLEHELRARNEQLAASEEAKIALIDRLRYAIDELSNPILEVWDDVLVIPIIGVVDLRRTADMVKRLLAEVTRTQASFVIVDLTGVEIVDTKTADHLMKLVRKVEIVGARCVLTGIRPAVSETLVDIGVDLGRLTTLRNLKHGLRAALRFARHERDGLRDLGGPLDERPEEAQPRRS